MGVINPHDNRACVGEWIRPGNSTLHTGEVTRPTYLSDLKYTP